jgi:hypothetical protein
MAEQNHLAVLQPADSASVQNSNRVSTFEDLFETTVKVALGQVVRASARLVEFNIAA